MDFSPRKVFVLCNVPPRPTARSDGPNRCQLTQKQAVTELGNEKTTLIYFQFLISLLHFGQRLTGEYCLIAKVLSLACSVPSRR